MFLSMSIYKKVINRKKHPKLHNTLWTKTTTLIILTLSTDTNIHHFSLFYKTSDFQTQGFLAQHFGVRTFKFRTCTKSDVEIVNVKNT